MNEPLRWAASTSPCIWAREPDCSAPASKLFRRKKRGRARPSSAEARQAPSAGGDLHAAWPRPSSCHSTRAVGLDKLERSNMALRAEILALQRAQSKENEKRRLLSPALHHANYLMKERKNDAKATRQLRMQAQSEQHACIDAIMKSNNWLKKMDEQRSYQLLQSSNGHSFVMVTDCHHFKREYKLTCHHFMACEYPTLEVPMLAK
ncbi:unnamed protein product [Chrysoparadoxa australica]